ncbi:Fibrinogen alpha chain [Bienertia sinuspersici]
MAALSFGIATLNRSFTNSFTKLSRPRISCVWDPEGVFRTPPQTGHLARLEFKKRIEKDAEAKDAYEQQLKKEKERRQALRESRVIPDTEAELIEYFLDTEAQEIEFEVARLRPRQDMEDRLIELEALQKALLEATGQPLIVIQKHMIKCRTSCKGKGKSYQIFTSKDVIQLYLLDMVEKNELNRSLVTLLDENIASAHRGNQKQAAEYMEKLRSSVLKYVTV